jgi:hypothetical protein
MSRLEQIGISVQFYRQSVFCCREGGVGGMKKSSENHKCRANITQESKVVLKREINCTYCQ